jgi:hypothetical protein
VVVQVVQALQVLALAHGKKASIWMKTKGKAKMPAIAEVTAFVHT